MVGISGIAGADNPHVQPWQQQRIEALLMLDRVTEADAALKVVEHWLAEHPHVSPPWSVVRLRAQLSLRATGRLAEEEVTRVLSAAKGDAPYEEALLRLELGSALRRRGNRRTAVLQLEPALVALRGVGSPIAARAELELTAAGQHPPAPRPAAQLTRREASVAELVAKGLTNREVAAELFLSVKTVEFHLGRIYAKLGIRSRGGIAAGLAK